MKAKQLESFLGFAIRNRLPILVKGQPGTGKTDIISKAAIQCNANMVLMHPVVSDPTDFKGMPLLVGDQAMFAPFGDLNLLINATALTVCFLDDLGQAPAAVQAACMQLILARRINGHKISDYVTFIAATNRREDKAAVSGILEPVKSRFASIVELEVSTEDWVEWALDNEMPIELVQFIRFKPEMLNKFEPSRDIVNSPCPRTVAYVGKLMNAGLPEALEFEAFKGACGEPFAVEFKAFLRMYRELPSVDEIVLNPAGVNVPTSPSTLYAVTGMLSDAMNTQNIAPIVQFLDRLPAEMAVVTMKNVSQRNRQLCATRPFIEWATKHQDFLVA